MALLHFITMYFLMYSMVNTIENIHLNFNQLYMAGIMTAPMLIIEILLMGSMYENKRVLNGILIGSFVLFVVFFFFIRKQTAITDNEFLRSMIPHHSGAILMCREASLTDPKIRELCTLIIESQQEEIKIMEELLQ